MKIPIVRVGNSRGIRLPKAIIEECGFDREVNLEVKNQTVVLSSVDVARSGWGTAFKRMAENEDDQLLMDSIPNEWDDTEWEWK